MPDPKPESSEIESIYEALRGVLDPELGVSVLDVGFIHEITDTDDGVHITMILTGPFSPRAHTIVSQVQQAAEKATDKPVKITLGTELWDPSMISQGE